MLREILRILSGTGGRPPSGDCHSDAEKAVPVEAPEADEDSEKWLLYGEFPLRVGHELATRLQEEGIGFKVGFDDGIDEVNERYGSCGQAASMSLYLERDDWHRMNEIVLEHET